MTPMDDMEAVARATHGLEGLILALAKLNVPPDVQELLFFGDGRGIVAAGALAKALRSSGWTPPSEGKM